MKILTLLPLSICVLPLFGCNKVDKITVYTRDTTSGTRDGFFTNIGFSKASTENTDLADGYVELAGNGDIIQAIKNDENGIGYISLSTLETSTLKGLEYNGVTATTENVLNETYKLTRNFNYIVRDDLGATKEGKIVEAFQAFLSTKNALETINSKYGIVNIPGDAKSWNDIKDSYPICKEDNSDITIRFGGSTSVQTMGKALSAEFSSLCGGFITDHNHTGSGDAYKNTQGSEKDSINKLHIGFLSRELKESEKAAEKTSGRLCIDAIVAVVNKSNNYSNTTATELKNIYKGTIVTWSELKGK